MTANSTELRDDEYVGNVVQQVPKFLTKDEIKYYSQINSWRFMGAVLLEVATIALTIWLCEHYWSIWMYLLAVIVIGSRLHAFGILMHDAAHYRAFENRKYNDVIGELCAWTVTMTLQGYRNSHHWHHRELNTDKDLEWVRKQGQSEFEFPKTHKQMLVMMLRFLTGINAYREVMDIQKVEGEVYVSPTLKKIRTAGYLTVLVASVVFGFWQGLILYWVVPLLTSLMFFAHVRAVADHFCIEYQHMLNHTRTVTGSRLEMHLFAPHGINYHIEHHLYPGVPFHRLGELHRYLMTKEFYAKNAHVTQSYWGVYKECLHPAGD